MANELTKALLIILAIDALFFMTQLGILAINPDGPQFYNYNGSIMSQYDKGNYTLRNAQDAAEDLPAATAAVSTDAEGGFITDTFTTMKNWLTDIGDTGFTRGAKYIWSILGGPTAYLQAMNVPREFSFSIGVIWYGVTILLILSSVLLKN